MQVLWDASAGLHPPGYLPRLEDGVSERVGVWVNRVHVEDSAVPL